MDRLGEREQSASDGRPPRPPPLRPSHRGRRRGAFLACGPEFPTCRGGLLPFGSDDMVDVQLLHRTLMLLAVLAFAIVAIRRGAAGRAPWLVVALLGAQVLLGALNVWLGEHATLVVAHLALGTLLWATMVGATLTLLPSPVARAARAAPVPV